jgi:hypothetical protein
MQDETCNLSTNTETAIAEVKTMSTENSDYQHVLIAIAKTQEKILSLTFSLSRVTATKTAKSYSSLRSYQDTPFHFNLAIYIEDAFGNLITWDIVCGNRTEWYVEIEIFLDRKDAKATENIFSFPRKQIYTAAELIEALDWAIVEVETSINSRDISNWVEFADSQIN